MSQFIGTRQEVVGIDDLIHQSQANSLLCAENASSEQQVAGLLFPNLADEEVGNDCWNESYADFCVSELCFLSSQGEIADGCDSGPSCDGRSVHCCDRRLGKVIDRAEQPSHGPRVFNVLFPTSAY